MARNFNILLEKYKTYLEARKKSKNYYNIIKLFLDYLANTNINYDDISQETITNFFKINETYSINTRNQFIKAGRNFDIFLEKKESEWTKIKLMKTEKSIPKYLTPEDIENGKKYLKSYHSNIYPIPKIEALIDFMYYSGCRKAELLKLKREDFDVNEQTAKVYGKGKIERIVCYPEKVKKELEIYFTSEAEENNAFNITLGQIHYLMKLMGKYLNKNVYAHLLRHSFAKNLLYNKGVDINTVSKLLGHSSLTTTMIYVNPDLKTIKDTYKKHVG